MSQPPTNQTNVEMPQSAPESRVAHIVNEVVASRELLGKEGRILIEHQSMKYELRQTRQGKLILTK